MKTAATIILICLFFIFSGNTALGADIDMRVELAKAAAFMQIERLSGEGRTIAVPARQSATDAIMAYAQSLKPQGSWQSLLGSLSEWAAHLDFTIQPSNRKDDKGLLIGYKVNDRCRLLVGYNTSADEDAIGEHIRSAAIVGAAFHQPVRAPLLNETIDLNLNLHLLPQLEYDYTTRRAGGCGYAAELGVFYPISKWRVYLAYQYQYVMTEAENPAGAPHSQANRDDAIHGPRLTLSYEF